MNDWTVVVIVIALPMITLFAWFGWLGFAALITRWHGVDALKAAPPVAKAFSPREWALLIPRQVLTRLLALLKGGGRR